MNVASMCISDNCAQLTPAIVDVGIPVWGTAPYLDAAIASVEGQTMQNWRLFLSQDGPRNPAVEEVISSRRHDTRISYSATEREVGAPGNKSLLLRCGSSPYIALLDHDDVWAADFLSNRISFLERETSCGFVFSPLAVIDSNGAVVDRTPPILTAGVYRPQQFVPVLLRATGIPGATIVARRTAYRAAGMAFCDSLPRTYDYEMWVRIALCSSVGYLHAWDAYWRRHESNASLTNLDGYQLEFESIVKHLQVLIAELAPQFQLADNEWGKKVAGWLLVTALDATQTSDSRTAVECLERALRRHPRSVLDRRVLLLVLGLIFGHRGGTIVRAVRNARYAARLRRFSA